MPFTTDASDLFVNQDKGASPAPKKATLTCAEVLEGRPFIHVLDCGHVVKTSKEYPCGTNCKVWSTRPIPKSSNTKGRFQCTECVKANPAFPRLYQQGHPTAPSWAFGLPGNERLDSQKRERSRACSKATHDHQAAEVKKAERMRSGSPSARRRQVSTSRDSVILRRRSISPPGTSPLRLSYRQRRQTKAPDTTHPKQASETTEDHKTRAQKATTTTKSPFSTSDILDELNRGRSRKRPASDMNGLNGTNAMVDQLAKRVKKTEVDNTKRGLDNSDRPLFIADALPKDQETEAEADVVPNNVRKRLPGFFSYSEKDMKSRKPINKKR